MQWKSMGLGDRPPFISRLSIYDLGDLEQVINFFDPHLRKMGIILSCRIFCKDLR